MSNETVPLPNTTAVQTDTEETSAIVHTLIVESGPVICSEVVKDEDFETRPYETVIADDFTTYDDNDCVQTDITIENNNRDQNNSDKGFHEQQDSNSESDQVSKYSEKTLDSASNEEYCKSFNINIP